MQIKADGGGGGGGIGTGRDMCGPELEVGQGARCHIQNMCLPLIGPL
jgi:hypothetical protein